MFEDTYYLHGWIPEGRSLFGETAHCDTRCEIDAVDNELVRMLGFEIPSSQVMVRKVLQVERHDGLSSAPDRGGHDMPVSFVGQIDRAGQRFKLFDHCVRHRITHQLNCAGELLRSEILSVAENTAGHLIQYQARPARADDAGRRDPDQEITEWGRIQNTGIVYDSKGGQAN